MDIMLFAAVVSSASPTTQPLPVMGVGDISARIHVGGDYDLCQRTGSASHSWVLCRGKPSVFIWIPVLEGVTAFAAEDSCIYGRISEQYFLVQLSKQRSNDDMVRVIPDAASWLQSLAVAGIHTPKALDQPGNRAAVATRLELRPWEYVTLRGLAGMSDDEWAFVLFIMGVIGSGIGALLLRDLGQVVVVSLIVGVVTGMTSDLIVFGGPALGVAGQPICTVFVAVAAYRLRRFLSPSYAKTRPEGNEHETERGARPGE